MTKTAYYHLQSHFFDSSVKHGLRSLHYLVMIHVFPDCASTSCEKKKKYKNQGFILIWPQREKEKSCPYPRPICDHYIRIISSVVWSQSTTYIDVKVWWRKERIDVNVWLLKTRNAHKLEEKKEAIIKKKKSGTKTSILSCRKSGYIHHITRARYTRRCSLHESKLINASGYKAKPEESSIWNASGKAVSSFLKTILI